MSWDIDDIPDQHGRVAVVTGANSGLGFETAKALAAKGARVVMACRRPDAARDAMAAIEAAVPDAQLELVALDLADLASVAGAAAEIAGEHPAVDLLINNAGVMAVPERRTADGFEMQLGTNHLGHFALTGRLLDRLIAAGAGSRVVSVSSIMHIPGRIRFDDPNWERSYSKWPAYCQSKLANLLFSAELQRRLTAISAPTIAVTGHPGYAHTNLQTAGPEMAGAHGAARFWGLITQLGAQSAAAGALPILRAATDPAAGPDSFYGPRWVMRGAPAPSPRMPQARDEVAAAKLWDLSVELTGVDFLAGV